MDQKHKFIGYVWSFYGKGQIDSEIPGLQRHEVLQAVNDLMYQDKNFRCIIDTTYRKRVRDIIIQRRIGQKEESSIQYDDSCKDSCLLYGCDCNRRPCNDSCMMHGCDHD